MRKGVTGEQSEMVIKGVKRQRLFEVGRHSSPDSNSMASHMAYERGRLQGARTNLQSIFCKSPFQQCNLVYESDHVLKIFQEPLNS